jgi:uridine kinase
MAVRTQDLGAGPAGHPTRGGVLARLAPADREAVLARAEPVAVAPGDLIHLPSDAGGALYVLLEGAALLRRDGAPARRLAPGEHFGELAPAAAARAGDTVLAETALSLARLSSSAWAALERDAPATAARLALAVAAELSAELAELSGEMGLLLGGRTLARAKEVAVRLEGAAPRRVRSGARLGDLLPAEVGGDPVVAGLLGHKPVSLATPLFTDGDVAPLTLGHWEGRQIYAQSLGLLLLEAAHQVAPALRVRMGPSRGTRQEVEVEGGPWDRAEVARRIGEVMARLAAADVPIRLEVWPTDEAAAWFAARGWDDAAGLLRTRLQATVRLVSCGEVHALSMGPLLPSTGAMKGFRVTPGELGLALELGERDPRVRGNGWPAAPPQTTPRDGDMVTDHRRWLAAMGVTSVGAFNELCISGQVSQLIRVAEGFHEKRIGRIADQIAAARERIRVISIAGPSSSGKSTFIKRLKVQLQIDGVNPVGVGLDDYYVDRERTPRDARGEWDFEALEALDLPLLQGHVRRLLAGEAVRTARYDFLTGRSLPEGGPIVQLRPGDVLMLEGIHGLNPRLLGPLPREEAFRVFVHPATTLPFDRLTRTSATDLRLLRRIVRDRHQRGYSAADNILRWPSVQAGEREHIFPFLHEADAVFDTSLVYEPAVLKVFAERYLLEVPQHHAAYPTAHRLRYLVDRFVSIYPDHVPPTSLVREFIGGSGFEY